MIETFPRCIPTWELALKKHLFLSLHNQWQAAYLTSCPGKEKIEKKKKKSNFGDVEIKGTTSVAGARPCSPAICHVHAPSVLERERGAVTCAVTGEGATSSHPRTCRPLLTSARRRSRCSARSPASPWLWEGNTAGERRKVRVNKTRWRLKNGRRLKSRLPNASKQTFSPYRGVSDYCL